MAIALVPAAGQHDRAVLANLLQLYLYDFSVSRRLDPTPEGTFAYPYLDHYFVDGDGDGDRQAGPPDGGQADGPVIRDRDREREACFITADAVRVGFSMTRRLPDGSREMSEFFVLRRRRRHGIGATAALQVLGRHPGPWTLRFDRANDAAARFWPRVVAAAADGPVRRHDHLPPEAAHAASTLRFHIPAPAPRSPVAASPPESRRRSPRRGALGRRSWRGVAVGAGSGGTTRVTLAGADGTSGRIVSGGVERSR